MQISDQLVEGVDAEQVANQKENQQRLETYEQPQEDVLKDIQQLDAVHFSLHHFLCLFFLFLEIFEGLVDPAVSEPRDSYQQQDNRNADQEGSVEFVDEVGGVDIVLLRGQYDSRDQCPQGSRSDDFIDYSLIGFTAELFGADELGEHLLFGEAHSYCPYKADFQDVCEHNNAIINTQLAGLSRDAQDCEVGSFFWNLLWDFVGYIKLLLQKLGYRKSCHLSN